LHLAIGRFRDLAIEDSILGASVPLQIATSPNHQSSMLLAGKQKSPANRQGLGFWQKDRGPYRLSERPIMIVRSMVLLFKSFMGNQYKRSIGHGQLAGIANAEAPADPGQSPSMGQLPLPSQCWPQGPRGRLLSDPLAAENTLWSRCVFLLPQAVQAKAASACAMGRRASVLAPHWAHSYS
jgi:hypothetical protein